LIRFSVIRASKVLFILSLVVLIAVIGFIIFRADRPVVNSEPAAALVQTETAETQTVFAVSLDDKGKKLPHDIEDRSITVEILKEQSHANKESDSP